VKSAWKVLVAVFEGYLSPAVHFASSPTDEHRSVCCRCAKPVGGVPEQKAAFAESSV